MTDIAKNTTTSSNNDSNNTTHCETYSRFQNPVGDLNNYRVAPSTNSATDSNYSSSNMTDSSTISNNGSYYIEDYFTINGRGRLNPVLKLMLRTIIELKKDARLKNDIKAMAQFAVLDHVLSVFKLLNDIQESEKVNTKKSELISTKLPYVINFLERNNINVNNILKGIKELRNMIKSNNSNKKRYFEDTTTTCSTQPTISNKITKYNDLACPSNPIVQSFTGGPTFSTPQRAVNNQKLCVDAFDFIDTKFLCKDFKDNSNITPLKLELTMHLLDHPKSLEYFILEKKFSREFLKLLGDEMFISMLLCSRFNVMLFPNPNHVHVSFLHCLADKLVLSVNTLKSKIIEYIDKNINSISIFLKTVHPSNFDFIDINKDNDENFNNSMRNIFLTKYKEEISTNRISDITFIFLYNHLHHIFSINIIVFTFRNNNVELKYCPQSIHMQTHEFNEDETFAIIEDSGFYKPLWRMEPKYQLSKSANSASIVN